MKDGQYHLGVVSVSFRQHTPEEILEATRAAGLSYIEWGSDVYAPLVWNEVRYGTHQTGTADTYGAVQAGCENCGRRGHDLMYGMSPKYIYAETGRCP